MKWFCSKKDLRKALEEIGQNVSEAQLRELIAEVDVNQNSTIEEEEFLIVSNRYITITWSIDIFYLAQLMSALKSGAVAHNRVALIMDKVGEHKKKIDVVRSGGGV